MTTVWPTLWFGHSDVAPATPHTHTHTVQAVQLILYGAKLQARQARMGGIYTIHASDRRPTPATLRLSELMVRIQHMEKHAEAGVVDLAGRGFQAFMAECRAKSSYKQGERRAAPHPPGPSPLAKSGPFAICTHEQPPATLTAHCITTTVDHPQRSGGIHHRVEVSWCCVGCHASSHPRPNLMPLALPHPNTEPFVSTVNHIRWTAK
ncbi:hypothetical protein DM02DRAFT_729595 [Periconia macrospinosa]|uniref:Uncharacterized protein n=1 Tax=Periconia macrospinosa TaxID=97972 RepID=A0A2V1DKY4_9PLEO|nr:hypothetical protein DM02DRAFT_729595 [Periconia macrospinosa]